MSMTREEAIAIIERVKHTESKWPGTEDTLEALDLALAALRGPTMEMVEKMGGSGYAMRVMMNVQIAAKRRYMVITSAPAVESQKRTRPWT